MSDTIKIYVLMHRREDIDSHDEKQIGCYSSYEKALLAKIKRENLSGFKRYPKGFRIEIYEVDRDCCVETIYID